MVNLVIALVILVGGWWLLRQLGNAQPAHVRALMRKVAGAGIMAAAGFLALRGAIQIAAPLFLLGLGMFGNFSGLMNNGAFWKKPSGKKSRVATSILEMELDHDTGAMDGVVRAGALQGRQLSSLSQQELVALKEACTTAPDQSRALFDAWLQRTRPEFRAANGSQQAQASPSGRMSRKEALAILGLQDGATAEDIRSAHKRLMKQFHPDRGGTDYLAAKINLAKDTLLQV